jgi:SAM-dependent methyltransferase
VKQTYDTIGRGYSARRQTDPRFFAQILRALGDAQRVVNIGAGTGSYEPDDRFLVAVEPSVEMIRQRTSVAPVLRADATALPFGDQSFDAAMAILTIHHWPDPEAGLEEMQRVASRQVILTHTIVDLNDFWLTRDYFPEIVQLDLLRFQPLKHVADKLNGRVEVVPVPWDCVDGHLGAFWRRPEAYLDPQVRAGMSMFPPADRPAPSVWMLDPSVVERGVNALADDLESGRWRERNGALLDLDEIDLGYRLVIA